MDRHRTQPLAMVIHLLAKLASKFLTSDAKVKLTSGNVSCVGYILVVSNRSTFHFSVFSP